MCTARNTGDRDRIKRLVMKYIDVDCLKAKLDEYYRKYQSKYMETRFPYVEGLIDALDLAEQVINTLQQEQPFLPNNLDDTAEKWCKENNKGISLCADKKSHYLADGMDAFKAGAKWMAEHLAGVRKMIEPEKKEGRTCCSSQGEVPNDSLATQSYENIPNGLEEAAEKSSAQYYMDAGYSPFPNVETAAHKSGFIAGAEWAMQHKG